MHNIEYKRYLPYISSNDNSATICRLIRKNNIAEKEIAELKKQIDIITEMINNMN